MRERQRAEPRDTQDHNKESLFGTHGEREREGEAAKERKNISSHWQRARPAEQQRERPAGEGELSPYLLPRSGGRRRIDGRVYMCRSAIERRISQNRLPSVYPMKKEKV